MSIELSNAVWKNSEQKSGVLLVLLALADYANAKNEAWPAVSSLARKCRMSERNVQRCIARLQRSGELNVFRNQGRNGSNVYKILLPTVNVVKGDANVIADAGAANEVTSSSSPSDAGATQSINESLRERTPIVPKGDGIESWIELAFNCFKQVPYPLRQHIVRALSQVIPVLDRKNADSLLKFYRSESLDSKEPPYSSRKHSPERLLLDLPRQLALAVQAFPLPKERGFTLADVHQYLGEKYPGCWLPRSLAEFDNFVASSVRSEVYNAMRKRTEAAAKQSNSESCLVDNSKKTYGTADDWPTGAKEAAYSLWGEEFTFPKYFRDFPQDRQLAIREWLKKAMPG